MWIISFFLALVVLAFIQVWFFSWYSLKSLSYRRWFSPDIANIGETVEMYEVISNKKLFPIPWIRIEAGISPYLSFGVRSTYTSGGRHFHRSVFALGPYTTITRRHRVQCLRRGYYIIPSVAATAGDLLGLGDNKSVEIPTNTVITVYPEILQITEIFNEKNSFSGDIIIRRWIIDDPFMIRGVRDYTGLEPFNRINWKMTAKTGELQVHDYDFTSDMRLMVIVNIDMEPWQWTVAIDEEKAERTLSIAASIVQYALDNGVETGFATNGRLLEDTETITRIDPHSGAGHLADIFETISKTSLMRVLSFSAFLQEERLRGLENYDILVITAYTDKSIDEQIEAIRAGGNYVEVMRPDLAALGEKAGGAAI